LLGEAIDLPVLNLSRGGAGPDVFLDNNLIRFAQGARFVILQVMSGRSIGCPEYPGGRRVIGSDGKKVKRKMVLQDLWHENPKKAIKYVKRWNASYLETYRQLQELITVPTMLLWISSRAPADWKPQNLREELTWGDFPQLVGPKLYNDVSRLFADHIEHITGYSSEKPLSRITGQPCPYFGSGGAEKALHTEFDYYPTSESHRALAECLKPWAEEICRRT
jgi:hypothetical protein